MDSVESSKPRGHGRRLRRASIAGGVLSACTRFAPSWRSLGLCLALLLAAAGLTAVGRSSSLFAVRDVEVRGTSPTVAAEVRRALEPLLGTSLVSLDPDDVQRRLDALPDVAEARHDRAFPHRLVIAVVPERQAAVLRRGSELWLVSLRGRVLRRLDRGAQPELARIWVPPATDLRRGSVLTDDTIQRAVRALRPVLRMGYPTDVATVRFHGELTFVLRSGFELRLGDETDIGLKLAVAREVVPRVERSATGRPYIDLTLLERPVSGVDLQAQG